MKVSVIGSGSWGTALSQAIVDNGHELLLYARTEKARDEINIEHTNKRYLKDAVLPNEIVATSDLSEAVTFADVIVIAVPTKVMRETARKINEYLEKPKYIIHVSKGLEMETNKRMSEVIKDEIISDNLKGVGVLMQYGDNAKAALLTRGLIEITRLGKKLGADEMTFLGLGGIGDLVVTCTSKHSRNYNCGYLIGQGYTLEQAIEKLDMVAEGVRTTKVCYFLSKKYNVYMPITENIYKVLYEGLSIKDCVNNLMKKMAAEELNKFE